MSHISACLLFVVVISGCATAQRTKGIFVEGVPPTSIFATSGVRIGDVISGWRRGDESGTIASPIELAIAETDQAPRGGVSLELRRSGATLLLAVPRGKWDFATRPLFTTGQLAVYEKGREAIAAKKIDEAIESWRGLTTQLPPPAAIWLSRRIGDAHAEAKRWKESQAAYDVAIALAEAGRRKDVAAWLWEARDNANPDKAQTEESLRQALAIREPLGETLSLAETFARLGLVTGYRGKAAESEQFHRRSLELRERLAPGSVQVAASLSNLAFKLAERDDFENAVELLQRSRSIQEGVDVESADYAKILGNLGIIEGKRGNLEQSQKYFLKVLSIFEKVAPGSNNVANVLNNLGLVALERGEPVESEEFHSRSLALRQKIAPDGMGVSASYHNLALAATARGDRAAAADFHERSLQIAEKVAPGGLQTGRSLDNLARISIELGQFEKATELIRRARPLVEKHAPNSLDVADLDTTEGLLALRKKELDDAERLFRHSLDLRKRLAPASQDEAESYYNLARVARARGHLQDAAKWLESSLAALESQKGRLGGSDESQLGFSARYAPYYREYIDVLIELDRPEDAFHLLERSRARGLLAILAQRELVFSADVPAELERQRKSVNREYDRVQNELAAIPASSTEAKLETKLGRLRELRVKQDEIEQTIRQRSPRFASLQYPKPFDLRQTQEILDEGTLLLAYSLGESRAHLFAVTRDAFRAFTIAESETRVRERVSAFRTAITRNRDASARGEELHRLLLAPAARQIAKSKRVVIVPDGPLHLLPFGALTDGRKFFIESKPIHTVLSSTVYAELKRGRNEKRGTGVVAFGDPLYPSPENATPAVHSLLRRGVSLDPLPAARAEVQQIVEVYPAAKAFLGRAATEEEAKRLGKDVAIVHFASHGYVDERFPLNSALVLTIPSETSSNENGLLQAWEIFERVRLDADLVTLSSCETALGTEMAGEGLIGLTRAFQYAGARSIVASLWSVADESTADLMRLFYTNLRAGHSIDESLRAAQVTMAREKALSPFHWAAFQLIGDWR